MGSKDYVSPLLIGLDTKKTQLEALQHVREGATLHHKELTEEDTRMEKKLKTMIRASGRNTQSYFSGGDGGNHHPNESGQGNDTAIHGQVGNEYNDSQWRQGDRGRSQRSQGNGFNEYGNVLQ